MSWEKGENTTCPMCESIIAYYRDISSGRLEEREFRPYCVTHTWIVTPTAGTVTATYNLHEPTIKEEHNMRYAVLQVNLGTPGAAATIVKNTVTADEAKLFAEATIAGLRGNLTVKQFFAITVVDSYTGKIVGAVVDAPPAVEWA